MGIEKFVKRENNSQFRYFNVEKRTRQVKATLVSYFHEIKIFSFQKIRYNAIQNFIGTKMIWDCFLRFLSLKSEEAKVISGFRDTSEDGAIDFPKFISALSGIFALYEEF